MRNDENESVLDLPEGEQKPAPKVYPKILIAGVGLVIIAAIIKITGFKNFGLALFIVSWIVLAIHFSLRLKSNFRHYKYICLRDLGRLGVVSAMIMRLLDAPFVLPVMILSGLIYAGGYFGNWASDPE